MAEQEARYFLVTNLWNTDVEREKDQSRCDLLQVCFVPFPAQIADVLTKPLSFA